MPVTYPILSSMKDWDEWYARARATALDLDIWEYVDRQKLPKRP